MLGRSDGVLNREFPRVFCAICFVAHCFGGAASGIRFGSSEIYEVTDTFAPSSSSTTADPLAVIEDALVVGQKIQGGTDERVVLFVKLIDGATLSEELIKAIKLRVRTT